MSDLASSAVAEAAQPDAATAGIASSSVQHSTVELSSPNQHADLSAATGIADIVNGDAKSSGFAPSGDTEPAEHAMLNLNAVMSGLAPQEDAESAEDAIPNPHDEAEPALSDSYEDDTFDDTDIVPAVEAVEAAADNPDIQLDSICEADTRAAAAEADSAAIEEVGVVMLERPLSPVAMQLAVAAAATAAAATTLHDVSAPASLAGNQADDSQQLGSEDAYDDDVFEAATAAQTDTQSEDGLVSSAQQPAYEEVGSKAGSTASSDLDDVTQAGVQADAEQAIDTRADESHENEAFGIEAEQSGLQTENSHAQASREPSSSGALRMPEASEDRVSAAQHSEAQVLAAQGSAAMASAPQPPPMRDLAEVRRPARPSRAFVRHAISLTQPDAQDSSRAGPPAMPQAPPGAPPRHRWVCLCAVLSMHLAQLVYLCDMFLCQLSSNDRCNLLQSP